MVFTMQDFVSIPLDDYLFQNKYPVGFTNRILMLKMPVTQRQWREVMHEMPWDRVYDFNNGIGDDLPITLISRHLVMDFCRKVSMQLGKSIRLPTEAEWEFGCRGGTSTHNYWGSDPAEYYDDRERLLNEACFPYAIFKHHPDVRKVDGEIQLVPVGGRIPNAYGLYDMLGLVNEWVFDTIDTKQSDFVPDRKGLSVKKRSINHCSVDQDYCYVRGAGISSPRSYLRYDHGRMMTIDAGNHDIGFRVVLEL